MIAVDTFFLHLHWTPAPVWPWWGRAPAPPPLELLEPCTAARRPWSTCHLVFVVQPPSHNSHDAGEETHAQAPTSPQLLVELGPPKASHSPRHQRGELLGLQAHTHSAAASAGAHKHLTRVYTCCIDNDTTKERKIKRKPRRAPASSL
eukprot:SAG31_NODE_3072_length_4716_cov_4.360840_2_plen_148_part_00